MRRTLCTQQATKCTTKNQLELAASRTARSTRSTTPFRATSTHSTHSRAPVLCSTHALRPPAPPDSCTWPRLLPANTARPERPADQQRAAMDRRKTLAGLSPSQLNSRASLAPARGGAKLGAAGKLPLEKALSRMSLAGPVARRSSAYTTKISGVRSDPRPIGDKGFQGACVRTVIAYLAGHGFEYAITPKVSGCCCWVLVGCLLSVFLSVGCWLLKACGGRHDRRPPPLGGTHTPPLPPFSALPAPPGAGQPHDARLCQRHAVPAPPV